MAGPYVYTRDAYMTSDVMATVKVAVSPGTWHWPVGYSYMYSQFRVDGGEWIRVPAEELSLGILCFWGSIDGLFSFNVPGGASIVETRGAADAYYNVTHKYKETIYGTIRTLTVPPDEDTPWVATRSVYFANDTTINISAEGDPGSYASAVLYMQYREEGGSSSDTGGHNITTLTTHSWDITVTPGVDYEARAALAYNSSIIYGAWYSTKDDIETDDGCIDPPSSGAGILSDPYVITDICQLNWIKTTPNAHYILGNDIDASPTVGWNRGAGFEPIGSSTGMDEPPTLTSPFTGSFNGKEYKILNLHINRPTWNGVGLFGAVDTTGYICNVGMVNVNITGNFNVGGLVGTLYGYSKVSHCYSSGSVTGYGIRIGGLVGWIYGSKVVRSYSSCNIVGAGAERVGGDELGGLVGDNDYGNISESYATGDVSGSNYNAGGLVGQIDGRNVAGIDYSGSAAVVNCYARGAVNGFVAGGLTATIIAESTEDGDLGKAVLKYVYSTGSVTGSSVEGGLNAFQTKADIIECFWDKETSGQTTSEGGTGETTANMKKETTFTSVGWDFDTLWDINELINDGYPYFGKSGDEVEVGQLIYLAVPSEKDAGGSPSLDHFSCYDVITRDGQYSDSIVYLEDQFVKVWATVEEPILFGNPTKKVYGGDTTNISEPDHHFVFYNITLLKSGEVVQDDFEWGSDGDRIDTAGGDISWIQDTAGASKAEIDTAQSVSGTRSLRLYYDGTNSSAGYFYNCPDNIKFNMRKDGSAELMIWCGDGTYMIDLRFRSTESFGYGYENGAWTWTQLEVLSIDTWYEVEIKNINWSAATYDIWLDGDELKIGAAMRVKEWASGSIRFGNSSSGTSECWIDDVYVIEGIQSILDRTVDIENQLSIHTITVSGPIMLAVPTKKGDHSLPSGLDHFLVYDVITGSSPDKTVDITDQFGTQSSLVTTTPTYFANPTKKTHGDEVVDIVNSMSHLILYTVSGISPECFVNVVSQVTPEPPIIFASDVTGLFVRGDEIQVIMSNLGFRSPDFGTNWYALNGLPTDGVKTVGFDANNPQNSFVGCDNEVYVFDNATGQKYNYVKSDLGIISGMTTSIDVDLDGMGALGTDNALHKTLDFGHTTHLWLDEPVTDVSIGGSHVINPSCYFNPAAANDAELSKTDGDYSTAWNGTTGTVYNGDSTLIGQALSETSIYGIYRFGLAFDTTTLSGTIVSAGIRLYVNQVEDGASFNVVVQGDNTYPSTPVVAADYARTKYSGDGGSVASSNILAETHLTIPLNSTGIGWINAGGISRFIIRTDEDINGSAPSVNEYIKVNQSEKGSVHAPMLIVTLQTEL